MNFTDMLYYTVVIPLISGTLLHCGYRLVDYVLNDSAWDIKQFWRKLREKENPCLKCKKSFDNCKSCTKRAEYVKR